MHTLLVDVLFPVAGIALMAMLIHNSDKTSGAIATVTSIYKNAVTDIQS